MTRPRLVSAAMLVLSLLAFSLQTEPSAAPSPKVVDSKAMDGADGGVLHVGMWTVQVPAGAYGGSATLSAASALAAPRVCQLEINPPEKNSFERPVTLTVKLPQGQVSFAMRIQWFDPATQTWKTVPGSKVSLSQGTVSAPLYHFSLYQVADGRTGW